MATIFLLVLSALIFTAEAQQGQSNIVKPGSLLTPTTTTNSSWLSPSGLYAFGFFKQSNCYAVGIFVEGSPQKTSLDSQKRQSPGSRWCHTKFHKWWTTGSAVCTTRHEDKHCQAPTLLELQLQHPCLILATFFCCCIILQITKQYGKVLITRPILSCQTSISYLEKCYFLVFQTLANQQLVYFGS